MKKSFIVFFTLLSMPSFADQLSTTVYRSPEEIIRVLKGQFRNLENPNCPASFLDTIKNKANFAMGAKMTGISVVLMEEAGRKFYSISPEFLMNPLRGADSVKCYLK